MFYVVYSLETKQYLNDQDSFGPYENAAQLTATVAHNLVTDYYSATCRVVGPCVEGETP